jgi:hypothetical protein
MSTKGEEEKRGKSETTARTRKEAGETSVNVVIRNKAREETQPVKLADMFHQAPPRLPEPKRRQFSPLHSGSKRSEDGHIKSDSQNSSDDEHNSQFVNSYKPLEDGLNVENSSYRPVMIPCSQLDYQQPLSDGRQGDDGQAQDGDRSRHSLPVAAGCASEHDHQQKPLHKDKYVDSSVWHRLLHPEQRNVKRCRPSENRFDATNANTRFENQQNYMQEPENRKFHAVEEGVGPLHITEDRPVRLELVDEEFKNVELRPKKRLDSVGTDYLKEIQRQLEVIEQGQLANLHLDPADEDPELAAVIPRPDVYTAVGPKSGEPAFQRGEPVRRSEGGVVETTGKSRSRPRAHTDNGGLLLPDVNVTPPSRRSFGRTPVRRRSKSPTSSPRPRRVIFPYNGVRTQDKDNVSYKVCIAS